MLAFVFPGQGSQRKGMGAEFFDSLPQFLEHEEAIDELLGYSLRRLCLENPRDMLRQTEFTQPCLYVVNALHHYHRLSEGDRPGMAAGLSLGEYNALHLAGAFDFFTGLRLVHRRGELMSESSKGAMTAVMGLDVDTIQNVIAQEGLHAVEIANFNSPSQIVVSGDSEQIRRIAPAFMAAGAQHCIPLQVSAAFHSRLMAEAAEEFAQFLDEFSFQPLRLPVLSNATGLPYPDGDPDAVVRAALTRQICEPVMWMQSVQYMKANGVTEFREVGPGRVLTEFLQEID